MSTASPSNLNSLADFLKATHENSLYVLQNSPLEGELLEGIHSTFRYLLDNLGRIDDQRFLVVFMVQRAHSSFLAATHLSTGGKTTESYLLQRGCLESALYGFYFFKNPESQERWLKRDENKKEVRREFTFTRLKEKLEQSEKNVSNRVNKLYEVTIDFGAHPNPNTITHIEFDTPPGQHQIKHFADKSSLALFSCIKTNIDIGICALELFSIIFKERFEILSIDKKLQEIKTNLKELIAARKQDFDSKDER